MLRQLTILLGLGASLLAGAAWAGEAGKLVFVTGQVQVAGKPAKQDLAVQEGAELSTGADGYVYVKTVDNGFLILRPNSRARIVAYHVDAANPANTRVKLELLGGVARSISGEGVKQARQSFRFNTPVAAIGVRGTDFIIYTDQQTTRVAVVSGGVVVSGFAGPCGPEGSGPCEGAGSRELFAGQAGMLLQVSRGEQAPQLLRAPTSLSPAPDQVAPPRQDEPTSKPGASSSNATTPVALGAPAVVSLEAQKAEALSSVKQQTGDSIKPPVVVDTKPSVPVVPINPVAPVTPTDPVVEVPVEPVVPVVPEVLWGRYKAAANLPVDPEFIAKRASAEYEGAYSVGSYQITRLKNTAFVMPTEGTASFTLTGSDATLQAAGKEAVAASVKNAYLTMDFATRAFETGMTVYNSANSVAVAGKGTVLLDGSLVNDIGTYTTIRGYLGGAKAAEAAYIFRTLDTPLTAEGATTWRR